MDTEQFNHEAVAQHLKKGSFAPIFEQSNEKNDAVALKLMCIVDFETQRHDLYPRMQKPSPKLLPQLMQFHSYGTFKYYDYQVGVRIGKRVLKCKFCDLIGPYGLILTHMAINHNAHIGLKRCVYCNRNDLKEHFADETMEHCYASYLQRHDIEVDRGTMKSYTIVKKFYDMLKELSVKFGISTFRNYGFRGSGYQVAARPSNKYDNDSASDSDIEKITDFNIRTPTMTAKNISGRLTTLDREFKRVIGIMYGGNYVSRLVQRTANANADGNTVIISDDDIYDGDNERRRSRPTRSNRSSKPEPVASTSADAVAAETQAKRSGTPFLEDFMFEPVVILPTVPKLEPELHPEFDDFFETESAQSTSTIPIVGMGRSESSAKVTTTTTTTAAAAQAANLNATVSMDDQKGEVEQFGQYVVQRLYRQHDDKKRRKMESAIQQTIAKIEMEFLE